MMMTTWKRPRVCDVFPFASMVTMEGCTIALTIWAKTVITNGMSPFVFVVYTHTLSSLILIPFSFFFHRNDSTEQPLFTWNMFCRVFLMGLTGITIPQNLAFMGLALSSPIVVCAMGLTFPALSFIVSIILRKTNINLGSSSFMIKVIGTIVCFMGATMVELYKGPIIVHTSSYHLRLLTTNKYLIFSSPPHEHWILGGLFLAASSLSVSLWNNIQMGTAKLYPQPMKIASFYSVVGTIQTAALAFFVLERDPNAWKLDVSMEIPLIVLTATFVSLLRSCVHMWCMKIKGSFYVPMFRPLGLVFASIFGTSLPHSTLRYGSVIGTAIVALGYFTVMHGQMNEDESPLPTKKQINGDIESGGSSSEEYKVPLLQDQADVGV